MIDRNLLTALICFAGPILITVVEYWRATRGEDKKRRPTR